MNRRIRSAISFGHGRFSMVLALGLAATNVAQAVEPFSPPQPPQPSEAVGSGQAILFDQDMITGFSATQRETLAALKMAIRVGPDSPSGTTLPANYHGAAHTAQAALHRAGPSHSSGAAAQAVVVDESQLSEDRVVIISDLSDDRAIADLFASPAQAAISDQTPNSAAGIPSAGGVSAREVSTGKVSNRPASLGGATGAPTPNSPSNAEPRHSGQPRHPAEQKSPAQSSPAAAPRLLEASGEAVPLSQHSGNPPGDVTAAGAFLPRQAARQGGPSLPHTATLLEPISGAPTEVRQVSGAEPSRYESPQRSAGRSRYGEELTIGPSQVREHMQAEPGRLPATRSPLRAIGEAAQSDSGEPRNLSQTPVNPLR